MNTSQKLQWGILGMLTIGLIVLYYFHFTISKEVVYVDSAKLFSNYKGMIQAREAFKVKTNVWQANVDTLTNEVQQAIKDYEKEQRKMTTKERELTQELIRNKQQQLISYQQAIQQQSQQEDEKMTGEVLQIVNAFLQEYGEKKNYKIILAATQAGNIVYAKDGLDITNEVIAELNGHYAN